MWLATGHLVFIKVFGHFYEMFWYFYQGKTKGRKIKQRRKRKEKKPWLSTQLISPSPSSTAQPTSPLSPSSSSSVSPREHAVAADATPPACLAFPWPLLHALETPTSPRPLSL